MSCFERLIVCLTVAGLCLTGCSQTARDIKLDPNVARVALLKALGAWSNGKKPDELLPEITIGDPSWNSGRKLASFQIKATGEKSDGTNLHIPVVCKFEDAQGKLTTMETTYIVGTSPVITIFPQSGD